MSWVSDQLKERIKADDDVLKDSMVDLSTVVLGKKAILRVLGENKEQTNDAIEEIFKYYKIKMKKTNNKEEEGTEFSELDTILNPYGILYRTVELESFWYKDAIGPMLSKTKDGTIVALLPNKIFGYHYYDYKTGKTVNVTKKSVENLETEAIYFYKPFPQKSLAVKDLVFYMLNSLEKKDLVLFFLLTLSVQIVGMIFPYISNLLFSKVVPLNNLDILVPFSMLLLGMVLSSKLISAARGIFNAKIGTKLNLALESATMAKIMTLPTTFFRNHSSGDLASRMKGIKKVGNILSDMFFGNVLVAVCSLVYLIQMYKFGKNLIVPALALIIIELLFTAFSSYKMLEISKIRTTRFSKTYSLVLTLFNGIQKIKLCGAEKRAFSKWAKAYANYSSAEYDPPAFAKIVPAVLSVIPLISSAVLSFIAGSSSMIQTDFYTFMLSFAAISGAIMAASKFVEEFSEIKPLLNLVAPVLRTLPECSENKTVVNKLNGTIELNQVTFRYSAASPVVLNNVSLKIRAGQYVAIVGRTGCGKSTLMRLLLGFEKPQKGAIYYDGMDVEKVDLKSLRRNIGSVMQNGKLMNGDIFNNIVAAAPWLTLKDAWDAAVLAGIDKEIKEMPMGMFTLVSEGGGGLSGGQKQRIMIARALAPNPKVLFFDEATSALDNITQKQISDALDSLKKTRIVIAHRLSTIKNCDRIIVLDGGKVVEDGKYEELINKGGYFAKLVERQRVDV